MNMCQVAIFKWAAEATVHRQYAVQAGFQAHPLFLSPHVPCAHGREPEEGAQSAISIILWEWKMFLIPTKTS